MKLKLIVLYFFIIFKAYADECKNFEEKVLSIPTPASGVVSDGQQPKYDTGIFLEKNFNYNKGELFLKRDKDNYPVLRTSFFEKGLVNDSIQFINGKDLSKLKDNDIKIY